MSENKKLTDEELKQVSGGVGEQLEQDKETSICECLYSKPSFSGKLIYKCWANQEQKAANEALGKCAICSWVQNN